MTSEVTEEVDILWNYDIRNYVLVQFLHIFQSGHRVEKPSQDIFSAPYPKP